MLTRLKLKRGEGKLVGSPKVQSRERRERLPQYPTPVHPRVAVETPEIMSHEREPTNMTEDEKTFRKAFFDMTKMEKFLYEERNTRLQVESSKPPKGEGSSRGGNENGDKPQPSPPSSSSSSSQASSHSFTNTTLTQSSSFFKRNW